MKTLKAMKNIKDIKTFLLAGLVCFGMSAALTSCESELDEVPDNRTEIDTPEKVQLLLVSGYPQAVPAVICELFGDNSSMITRRNHVLLIRGVLLLVDDD